MSLFRRKKTDKRGNGRLQTSGALDLRSDQNFSSVFQYTFLFMFTSQWLSCQVCLMITVSVLMGSSNFTGLEFTFTYPECHVRHIPNASELHYSEVWRNCNLLSKHSELWYILNRKEASQLPSHRLYNCVINMSHSQTLFYSVCTWTRSLGAKADTKSSQWQLLSNIPRKV